MLAHGISFVSYAVVRPAEPVRLFRAQKGSVMPVIILDRA